MMIVCFEGS